MKVIFSHGKESGPWGMKIKVLAEVAKSLGCSVDSIDYRGMDDPDERVTKLVSELSDVTDDIVLVGSSMGGYVALMAAAQLNPTAVFLMAPALYMPGYEEKHYPLQQENVVIVHGWNDDIIPYKNAVKYAELNQSTLYLIDDGHRLVEKLDDVAEYFKQFLQPLV